MEQIGLEPLEREQVDWRSVSQDDLVHFTHQLKHTGSCVYFPV
jgi:hypothetical protein